MKMEMEVEVKSNMEQCDDADDFLCYILIVSSIVSESCPAFWLKKWQGRKQKVLLNLIHYL